MMTRSELSLEAAANRRRFTREGIALVVGARSTRYPVRTQYGTEIAIRPGYHIEGPRSDRADALIDRAFSAFERPLTWLAVLAVAAIAFDLLLHAVR